MVLLQGDAGGSIPAVSKGRPPVNKSIVALSALLALSVGFGSAVAQDKTREQVKAEAKQAAKSPAGKGEYDCPPVDGKSSKTRADVKGETQAAAKAGTLKPGNEACENPTGKSVQARADVKAEAKEAAKSPAGKGEADVKK